MQQKRNTQRTCVSTAANKGHLAPDSHGGLSMHSETQRQLRDPVLTQPSRSHMDGVSVEVQADKRAITTGAAEGDGLLPDDGLEELEREHNQDVAPLEPTIPERQRDNEPYQPLCKFKALARRSWLSGIPNDTGMNPLEFYADVRLTPITTSPSIFHVVQCAAGLRESALTWKYTLVSHGSLTHSWSLLPIKGSLEASGSILRPIGVLETFGKHIGYAETQITDLAHTWTASSIRVFHFPDSWSLGGIHVGFQVDNDHYYEWKPVEFPPGSGKNKLILWRVNTIDGGTVPAARLLGTSIFQHPIDNSNLWSLELDIDRIEPHLALLSAFSLKLQHTQFHAFFASKKTRIPPAVPLVNFAFQDEGHVYQPSSKYWPDWEASRTRREQSENSSSLDVCRILLIRVFNKAYLEQFALPSEVLAALEFETRQYVLNKKAKYGIFY